MAETSIPWDGTTTGDATAAPYDFATEVALVFDALSGVLGLANKGGVVRDARSEYGATTGANQVTIAAGTGVCYGTIHDSTANVDFTVSTPAGSTRVDRIVLRKSWVAQTVRLVQIAGVEGAGAPAITQTPGTTWDVPLWRASITTGGVITLTDDRVFVPVHGDQSTETGTKHDFNNLANAPAPEATVADIVPGAAGVPGASTDYSAGDHSHFLAPNPNARRTTDGSVVNSTTLTNDSVLQVTLPAAGVYRFEAMLLVTCAINTVGIKIGFNYDGSLTNIYYGAIGLDPSDVTLIKSLGVSVVDGLNSFGADATDRLLHVVGTVEVADSDVLHFEYAQNTIDATNDIFVLAGSYLIAERLY